MNFKMPVDWLSVFACALVAALLALLTLPITAGSSLFLVGIVYFLVWAILFWFISTRLMMAFSRDAGPSEF